MPRFYFDIPGSGLTEDALGLDLPDQEAAREHARIYIRELLRKGVSAGWDMHDWRLVVTDSDDRVVVDIGVTAAATTN